MQSSNQWEKLKKTINESVLLTILNGSKPVLSQSKNRLKYWNILLFSLNLKYYWKQGCNDSRSSKASTAMDGKSSVFDYMFQQLFDFLFILRDTFIRPTRIMNVNILSVGQGNIGDRDGSICNFILLSIVCIVEASDFPVLNDIAEHNYAFDFILSDHLLELVLGLFQWSLSNDEFSALSQRDPVGVDIVLSLRCIEFHSTVLI